jgi:P27 family predicted phage terminase small subunit
MATTPARSKRGVKAQKALEEALSPGPVFPYPKGLPEEHRELWCDTVNTKTGDYWCAADVPLLKMYCRNVHDVERLSDEIEQEGEVILNARENPVVNPKIVIRGFAEARLMALCTKLRLQPSSRMDTKNEANQGKRKNAAVKAAKTVEDDGDGLLAGGFGGDDYEGASLQ